MVIGQKYPNCFFNLNSSPQSANTNYVTFASFAIYESIRLTVLILSLKLIEPKTRIKTFCKSAFVYAEVQIFLSPDYKILASYI